MPQSETRPVMEATTRVRASAAVGGVLSSLIVLTAATRISFAACDCPSQFDLHHVASTTIEIAVAWQAVPNASGYVVERSSSCDFSGATTYDVSNAVTVYGDTGRPPDDKYRFHVVPGSPAVLTPDATYNYRVRALVPGQSDAISNCVEAQVATEPVRGVSGDLWADVVLGQPDFAQNDFAKTTDRATEWAGGVLIDRTHTPNRMYVGDTNHNRVLGFDHVGKCSGLSGGAAVGRPYTKSASPNGAYPDGGNDEFTDGHDAVGDLNIDVGSFGYPHGGALSVDVDVDLGVATSFNSASLNSGGTVDRYTAGSFELFVSDNGSQWTSVGEFGNPSRQFTFVGRFAAVTARYARFRVHARTGCVDCDWLFLGEGRVGTSGDPERLCSVDADCGEDATCLPDPDLRPQIVLGQPAMTDFGACNGDGTGLAFPLRAPASATSLCQMDPLHVTPAETVYGAMMAVDAEGSLYVPDLFNHRILKFADPFGTDQVADDVWGQDDFAGNECNRGGNPAADTLCLGDAAHAGIDFDAAGSLWVADTMNARVLRFPNTGGGIAHEADVVLGQPSFDTRDRGNSPSQLQYPFDLTTDPSNGRLYVADATYGLGSRVLEFRPPFTSGEPAFRALNLSLYCNDVYPEIRPMSLTMDTVTHGLWVENSCWFSQLFDLDTPAPTELLRVQVVTGDGIDVNAQGDLFAVAKWGDLTEFKRDDMYADHRVALSRRLFSGASPVSSEAMRFGMGMTVLGNQLIGADGYRLLIWNDPASLASGQGADDVYGQPDFATFTYDRGYFYPQAYGGQLWVFRGSNGVQDILVFDPPLTNASVPVATIPLLHGDQVWYPVLGCPGQAYCNCAGVACTGPNIITYLSNEIDFAPSAGGDELWVADRWNNRVFRIANLKSQRSVERGPFVDVILGQADLAGTSCNRGNAGPAADTLCYPYDLTLDGQGRLWIADNGGEAGSNGRMLQFDEDQLAVAADATVAKLGVLPSRVLGTGGDFGVLGLDAASDPLISPFKPALHTNGALATGNNPYMTQRFGLLYLNPLEEQLPQLALGDVLSYPAGGMFFDAAGDLYVSDTNWSRILIYRQPLALFPIEAMPTRTPTATATPRPTATPIATCNGGNTIAPARVQVRRNLDPNGDEKLLLGGRIAVPIGTAIDPVADGVSFIVSDQSGGTVFVRNIAPGAAASANTLGWRTNRAGTRWTYRDPLGITPGGIRRVVVSRSSKTGVVSFRAQGSRSNFQVAPTELPLRLQVVFGGAPEALAGTCATVAFAPAGAPPPMCRLHANGAAVTCH